MKRIGIILVAAGVLTLAAHALHTLLFSGTELARYRLMGGPGDLPASGDVVAVAQGRSVHHAGPFALDASMNPLQAVLELRGNGVPPAGVEYEARLVDERGAAVWADKGVYRARTGTAGGAALALRALEVPAPGRYLLLLELGEGAEAALRSGANVVLKRNVARANPGMVGASVLALLTGSVTLLLAQRRRLRPESDEEP
jgi:hypothetical protein